MFSEIEKTLTELCQTVTEADYNYQVWWIYREQESRAYYFGVLDEYSNFFSVSTYAHFLALIISYYKLYEKRTDTENIPRLIKQFNELVESEDEYLNDKLNEADAIWIKVKMLRNKVYAHKCKDNNYEDIFKKIGITPEELRRLTKISLKILNYVSDKVGCGHCGVDEEFVSSDTLRLLDDLRAYDET